MQRQDSMSNAKTCIQHLPPEITTEILRECLPASGILDQQARLQFQTLRSVCKQWRDISFTTPSFWSGIELAPTDDNYENPPELLKTISSWFDRAGENGALKLTITCDDDLPSYRTHFRYMLMTTQWSKPLKELRITINGRALIMLPVLLERVRRAPHHPWSTLDTFELRLNCQSDPEKLNSLGWNIVIDQFAGLQDFIPQLKTLSVPFALVPELSETLGEHQMTSLTLDLYRSTTSSIISTISSLKATQNLTLLFSYPPMLDHTMPITHEHISTFTMTMNNHTSDLLRYLRFPSLKHLGFHIRSSQAKPSYAEGEEVVDVDSVIQFLESSECALKRLDLHSLNISGPKIPQILRLAPSLETLTIPNWEFIADASTSFLPATTQNIFSMSDRGFIESLPFLIEFAKSRAADPLHITILTSTGHTSLDFEELSRHKLDVRFMHDYNQFEEAISTDF